MGVQVDTIYWQAPSEHMDLQFASITAVFYYHLYAPSAPWNSCLYSLCWLWQQWMCCHLKNYSTSITFPTAAVNICHYKGFLPYHDIHRGALGSAFILIGCLTSGLSLLICHCVWITISMHLNCLDMWNEPQEMPLCSNEVVSNATVKCEPGFLSAKNFISAVYSCNRNQSQSHENHTQR